MVLKDFTTLQDGKYRILRVLGQGGFGITYLGIQKGLEREVAIKEFYPKEFCHRGDCNYVSFADNHSEIIAKLKRRFLSEAKNISKIDHAVFQENNTAYIVMEYIEGKTLQEMVSKQGKLGEPEAIEYICKIGDALECLHAKKLAHYDIKPSNIIIRDKDNSPILIDFGLSKIYSNDKDQTSSLLLGVSSGYTPIELYHYNSDDSFNEFSPKSDIYSLGATLLYMLTGEKVPDALSLVEEEIKFPIEMNPQTKAVIKKSMATLKKDRYDSVRCFCDALHSNNNNNNNNEEETKIVEISQNVSWINVNGIFLNNDKNLEPFFSRHIQNRRMIMILMK